MYYFILSGKRQSRLSQNVADNLLSSLEKRNIPFEIHVSEYPGHSILLAKELSAKEDCEALVAVGGDGTFYEVLNGMDLRAPIGFIPAGTGNDLARTLGITPDLEQCLDNIIGQTPRYLDFLQVGEYRAFNVVGSGFDIQLLEKETELRATGKYSDKSSYSAALFHTILHFDFCDITFRLDDGEEQKEQIFMLDCCNGIWGAGKMPLNMAADPHDGYMDFTIIQSFPRIKLLPLLLTYKAGKLSTKSIYKTWRCKKVWIDISPKKKANLDGELLDLFPLTVELVHEKLRYFPSKIPPRDPMEILKDKKSY